MITCGIDIGSRTSKIVLYDSETETELLRLVEDSMYKQRELAKSLFETALKKNLSRDDISKTIATGYGRNLVDFADDTVTEITCHARGVCHIFPDSRTVIDIGGQDSKMIFIDENGAVRDFVINDRCAAGTGRFLEVAARILDLKLQDMGRLSENPDTHIEISGMCVVFAESEIIGLISQGVSRSSILDAVQRSISGRILSMAGMKNLKPRIVFTGGVALNSGMVRTLQQEIGQEISVPPTPQITGALGAAIIAAANKGKD